jgi:hypothetical protein
MQERTEEIAGAGWIRVSRGDQDSVWRVTWLPRHDRDDLLPAETFSQAAPDLPDDWPETNDPDDLIRWAFKRYEGMDTVWAQTEARWFSESRDSATARRGA